MRSPSGRRCASFHRIAAYFSMVMTLSVRSIILPILVVRLSGAAGDDAVLLANIAQARQASIEETPVETIRIQGGRAALKFLVCRHFGRSYARQIPVRIDGADIWFGNKRVVGKASGRHEACKEQSNNDNFRSGPHKLLRPFTHADATTHQSDIVKPLPGANGQRRKITSGRQYPSRHGTVHETLHQIKCFYLKMQHPRASGICDKSQACYIANSLHSSFAPNAISVCRSNSHSRTD